MRHADGLRCYAASSNALVEAPTPSPDGIVYALSVPPLRCALTDCSIDSARVVNPRRRKSEMPDVCDGVGNWGTAAEHVINITNLTGRRDTIFFDTIDHRQR